MFVTEISYPSDVSGTLFEDQFLVCHLALCDCLDCDVTVGNKCETTFNLKKV